MMNLPGSDRCRIAERDCEETRPQMLVARPPNADTTADDATRFEPRVIAKQSWGCLTSRRASSLPRRSIGLSPRDLLPSVSQRATMVTSVADMETAYAPKMKKPFRLPEKSAQ